MSYERLEELYRISADNNRLIEKEIEEIRQKSDPHTFVVTLRTNDWALRMWKQFAGGTEPLDIVKKFLDYRINMGTFREMDVLEVEASPQTEALKQDLREIAPQVDAYSPSGVEMIVKVLLKHGLINETDWYP